MAAIRSCTLLRLDARLADGLAPDVVLLAHVLRKFGGRGTLGIECLPEQAVAHILAREQRVQLAIQSLGDILRHARRAEHARPRRYGELGKSGFYDRRP